MASRTDTRFFTNSDSDSLRGRFLSTLKDARHFDVLVGYFRTSGFYHLYKELEAVEKIRILVGLNLDRQSFELIEETRQGDLDLESHTRCCEIYSDAVVKEMESTEESHETEVAARKFIEFIKSGKLEMRAHPSRNLHAKIYITRFREDDRDYGRVITGSSNFSESGLVAQREFNVELKDEPDVKFAQERFEELWNESVEVSEEYVDTVTRKTWLNDNITPYQIYLKFLYEYFKEDINADDEIDLALPEGFMDLEYQKQAVLSANKILETYNGVFLADVVGLGKTFITALLLQRLPMSRKLIICPPVLIDYWKETMHQFYVPSFEVESLGKLDQIIEKGAEKYRYIIVDEAHRFRNEMTASYEALHRICRNKKVILVSATPLNNKLEDILSQIKLFQPGKKSTIPGVQDLDRFFNIQQKALDEFKKGSPEYLSAVKQASAEVRDRVLKHIMVRRTRSEIKNYFGDDVIKEGFNFPEMGDPERIVYEFDAETEKVFNETIGMLKKLTYARYMPLLFLKSKIEGFEKQSQLNIGGFMKSILVKRLESSFHAFRGTLRRFISSYQRFIEMFDAGEIWISKEFDVFEFLDADDEGKLIKMMEEDRVQRHVAEDFQPDFRDKLVNDLAILEKILELWDAIEHDCKVEHFIEQLQTNPTLKGMRIIVFSESMETGAYLQARLDEHFEDEVLSCHSGGGHYQGKRHTSKTLRSIIEANYQPGHPHPLNDVKILIATDLLAEGINLHRSNIIINYDLPWNPTRVLQRVGRVNRVGTEYKKIHVFNIFPTSQSDKHLGLENNIKGKIQAFHNILGEDAKYLSDDEELSTHELFGDRLYQKLNKKETFEDDEEMDSELRYLQIIRNIRDKDVDLFASIGNLPKKARTGRELPKDLATNEDRLLTFFRKGRLKKFILANAAEPEELTFFEAAKLFECEENTKSHPIPEGYYDLLNSNKNHLEDITSEETIDPKGARRGASNESFIIKAIKAAMKAKEYTDEDRDYLKKVREALESGIIARNTSKKAKSAMQKDLKPLAILRVLREHIKQDDIAMNNTRQASSAKKEVILSEYLVGRR